MTYSRYRIAIKNIELLRKVQLITMLLPMLMLISNMIPAEKEFMLFTQLIIQLPIRVMVHKLKVVLITIMILTELG